MNVAQIISTARIADFEEAYHRLYPDQEGDYAKHFSQFQIDVAAAVSIQSGMRIRFKIEADGYCDVVGVDDEDREWALDFTPWGEWKTMEVDSDLTIAEQAAHLFEEMTWHGGPESMAERAASVQDAMEEVNRAIETGDHSAFMTLDDFLKELRDRDPKSDI